MTMLLADVGGTNARLALARNGAIDAATVTRFRDDDYPGFDDVVRDYLRRQDQPRISAVCVAVAGPVSGGRARLTNRDWDFDEDRLARLTDSERVRLINDLTALGYATPALRGDGVAVLRAVPEDRTRNRQALVVGLGTGFNVCAVRVLPGGAITCMEAEEGHTNLPANIMDKLVAEIGPNAREAFFSTEETFSGRGLSRLHAMRTNTTAQRSEDVAAAAESGDPEAILTYDLFAELVGLLARELALRFMPLDGMFLAGSVGRSLIDRMALFEKSFLAEPNMRQIPEHTPLYLIRDDMAALHGCLAALT